MTLAVVEWQPVVVIDLSNRYAYYVICTIPFALGPLLLLNFLYKVKNKKNSGKLK